MFRVLLENSTRENMLKKLFQQLLRFFVRLFSSHSKPFYFPKGSKKPPIRPIIFVPGSSASIQRFNGTIRMLHRFSRKKQSLLKIKVNKDDSIEMEGRLNTKEPNPMIVIGFENNRDGYSNVKQQIESLKLALTYLLDHYYFTEFKAVGHSNGGLVLTGLLESGFLEKNKLTVSKIAIIGSPYKFNQEMYDDFQRWKHRLDKEVEVLNFVGSFAGKSDGIVPLSSAQAAKSIFGKQTYSEVNLKGRKAQHSALPTNPELVKQLSLFLNL